jgi:hypothetical protein
MPINGLCGKKYYELLNIDPFQPTQKYPPSDSSVTLTENVNFKITHPTNQEAARMGVSLSLSGDGNRLLVGMPSTDFLPQAVEHRRMKNQTMFGKDLLHQNFLRTILMMEMELKERGNMYRYLRMEDLPRCLHMVSMK